VAFDIDTTLCQYGPVSVQNFSTGVGLNYYWNFGNGQSSTTQNPAFLYTDTGHFQVYLAIEDTNGCIDTAFKTVHVQAKPIANFFADTTNTPCLPLSVVFQDSSISDYIATWQWDWGDGTNSNTLDTSVAYHNYLSPGSFTVKLTVTTTYGCKASATRNNYINVSGPYAEFGIAPDSVCKGDEVSFFVTKNLGMASYTWVFGDGYEETVPATVDTVYHRYSLVGYRTPVVIYHDSANVCNIPFFDTVYVHEVKGKFTFHPDSQGCEVLNAQLLDQSLGADFYDWSFGDGRSSNMVNPKIYYHSPGSYRVKLSISNVAFGCADTLSKLFVVHPNPTVSASADTLICRGDSAALSAVSNHNPVAWQWERASVVSNADSFETWAFPISSQFIVAEATDTNGCIGVDSVKITVQDTPVVKLFHDTSIVIGETVVLLPVSSDRLIYRWIPEDEFTCTICPYPIMRPLESGTYQLIVNDVYGCFERVYEFIINVEKKYSADLPDAFSPNGDGVNDVVYARGWGIKEIEEFIIFNRWGEEVFRTNSPHTGWDGTFKGKDQSMDTYSYVLKVKHYDDSDRVIKGFIELIR